MASGEIQVQYHLCEISIRPANLKPMSYLKFFDKATV